MLKRIMAGLMCFMLLVGCTAQSGSGQDMTYSQEARNKNIIYVNAENTNSGDGSSWNKAFSSLQDALELAEANDEIWVAKGTYYPSENDSSVSFEMIDDVSIYGGFNGNETSRDERDWEANETILSGDIGEINVKEDNSKHVVIGANGILDGFTIKDGYIPMPGQGRAPGGKDRPPKGMNGPSPDSGGKDVGHSTPEQVLSGDASSAIHGAGIIIWETAPTIANCTITDNSAGKGGGVYIVNTARLGNLPIILNSTISNNYAAKRGAGVALDQRGNAIFIDCIFNNNLCDEKGGAVYHDFGSSSMFENCLFANNEAGSGAAFGNDGTSRPKISNCTLYGNKASEAGAALYQGTGPFNDPAVVNTIVWGNVCHEDEKSVYNWNECNPKIEYSLIEGGYVGNGIINTDPLLVNPDNMNFDLQSNSPCLTASSHGGRIGFDASLVDERTEDEYESLIGNLYDIEFNEAPKVMDLTNPVDSDDVSHIGNVIYVNAHSNSKGDGSSWDEAFNSLQDAINYANAAYKLNGNQVELWVAKGTYYTGEDRSDSIVLREGVSVYGGFDGTERNLEDRDYEENPTILSGDIGILNDASDNSYHVVIGSDDTILDGFTITGGNADKENDGQVYDNKGGGLLNYAAGNRITPFEEPIIGFDTVVRNCIFKDNYAVEGAASYTFHGANPVFKNCEFNNNTAVYGGAVLDRAGTNSKYIDCTFQENMASFKGGASFVDYGSMATFEECTFTNNKSGTAGGAIYVIDRASQATPNKTDFHLIDDTWPESLLNDIFSSVLIKNSNFENNTAGTNGGAIYVYESSIAKVMNTDFKGNDANENGDDLGIFMGSTLYVDDNSTFIDTSSNSIYIEDGSQAIY